MADSLVQAIEKISFASINYQKKVIKAFSFDEVYSLLPLNAQRTNSYQFSERGITFIHNKILGSKIIKLILDQWTLYCKVRRNSIVVFYNITIQNFILINKLTKIKECKCYVIVADYDDVQNHSGLKRVLQRIINSTFKLIKGAIVLNSNIQIPTRTLVLEGIVDEQESPLIPPEEQKNRIILSGSIGYINGVHVAIRAMDYLPEYELIITGPPYDLQIKDIEYLIQKAKNKNITYLGSLSRERYLDVLSSCRIALSLRDPAKLENHHNFPSKILEYLFYNIIVISTINYESVSNLLIICDSNPTSLAQEIKKHANLKLTDSREFVIEKFGLKKFRETLDYLIN